MSLCRHVAGSILAVALLGGFALAQNEDVPLGDVAKQQSGKKATKSFDDDNFQRAAPAPAADAKGADPTKADAAPKADAKAGEDADAPAEDVKALEKELADLKQKRDVTTSQIARLQSRIDSSDEGDLRDSLTQNQATYKQRLDEINAQIPPLEKRLEAARAAQKPDTAAANEEDTKPAESKPDDKSK